jgi:hypothetical protein
VTSLPLAKKKQNARGAGNPPTRYPVSRPSEPLYRKNFDPKCGPFDGPTDKDYKIDKENGDVLTTHGRSVGTKAFMEEMGWWTDDGSVARVDDVPDELGFVKSGRPGHYEIVPKLSPRRICHWRMWSIIQHKLPRQLLDQISVNSTACAR